MFSVEQCKKFLKENFPDEEIPAIRDNLYQLGNILVDNYFANRAVLAGT